MSKSEDSEKMEIRAKSLTDDASTLGSTFVCTGQISGQEDLMIKGTFKGVIHLKNRSLVIDKGGQVEGDIVAADVSLWGILTGNIRATGKVFLSAEAKMKGDIVSAKVSIQDGAQFRGSIKINRGAP